jgi:hypothetical protein
MCTWALLLQLALLLAAAAPSDSSDPPPGMRKISFKPPALDEVRSCLAESGGCMHGAAASHFAA